MTRTAETSARRSTGMLAVGETLACWQRSLAGPVRRAARTSALCAWVRQPPRPPRLRREPLLGRCLGEVLGDEPAIEREIGRDPVCPPPPHAVAKVEPVCPPTPERPRRTVPQRAEPPPVQQRRRVERELLCRFADEPEPAPVLAPPAKRPAVAVPPAPSAKRRAVPVPLPVERHARPAPCTPDAALAPATARTADRFRDATPHARAEVPEVVPGVRALTGPVAPAELLRRHLPASYAAGARRTRAARPAESAPRQERTRAADARDVAPARDRSRPAPERTRRTAARPPEYTTPPRTDLPVPMPVPTASERLGPAPVVTASHPPLYEPDPVGAPTVPVAGPTLRRGAARDAEVPDFLDGAELTDRIARVLQDEARRHGIEV